VEYRARGRIYVARFFVSAMRLQKLPEVKGKHARCFDVREGKMKNKNIKIITGLALGMGLIAMLLLRRQRRVQIEGLA
jgi:hypothetical protein